MGASACSRRLPPALQLRRDESARQARKDAKGKGIFTAETRRAGEEKPGVVPNFVARATKIGTPAGRPMGRGDSVPERGGPECGREEKRHKDAFALHRLRRYWDVINDSC